MKKLSWAAIKEGAKKVLMWFGAVFAAIFTVLFVKEAVNVSETESPVLKDDTEEINKNACKKRDEAIARINNASARDIAESYGTVCDTIAEGKERFKQRWTEYEDIRR